MKNKGLKILGGLAVLIIAAFVVVTLSLDGIVKSGIEKHGSELLQTEVSVDDVDVSLFGGTGSINGFSVQNPDDFSDEHAIYIEEASMKIDIRSIFSDVIVVNEIIVKNPQLFFEQKGIGANLKTLNDNMNLSSDESETNLIINYLLIENGTVKVSTSIERERTAEASLKQFELHGIGKDGSNTIKQSVHQVLEPLLKEAIEEAIKSGVTEQIEDKVRDFLDN